MSDRDKKEKKRVCNGLLFPGNLDRPSVQVVLASNWFAVARVVCEPLWAKKSRIWFWEENATTLSEFIEYIDLIDFRQISPKHSRINDKRKSAGKFWYLEYLSRGVHLRNMPRIFLVTPTSDADIWTTNQNMEEAWHSFVDWCLVNKTVQPFCLCCGIRYTRYPINSIEEPSVVSPLTGSRYILNGKFA